MKQGGLPHCGSVTEGEWKNTSVVTEENKIGSQYGSIMYDVSELSTGEI